MTQIQQDLTNIVGAGQVIVGDELVTRHPGYCADSQKGAVLVRPDSVEELSAIASYAHLNRLSLVPQGGLTGLVDGTAAPRDSIIVSLERMNRVLRVDPVQNVLVAQAGARLEAVQAAAAEHNRLIGLDIPSRGTCTVGGNISTNAGGIRVIRYGMTRDNILGLVAVLADGTVIDADNTLMKNNAGFDLKHLFIGSEGTLGIVAEVVFKLHPKPGQETTALVAVNDVSDVIALLSDCRERLGSDLMSFEVMWQEHYAGVTSDPEFGSVPLSPEYPLYAIVEAAGRPAPKQEDGQRSNHVPELQIMLEEALESDRLLDGVIAQSGKERQQIWNAREDADYLKTGFHELHSYDVGFEQNDIGPFVDALRHAMGEVWPEKPVYVFGHLGDGNLHIVLALTEQEHEQSEQFDQVVYEVVGRYANSTVSSEHGIGTLKKPYLAQSRSASQIALMKILKNALDPEGVLNPGKIL